MASSDGPIPCSTLGNLVVLAWVPYSRCYYTVKT